MFFCLLPKLAEKSRKGEGELSRIEHAAKQQLKKIIRGCVINRYFTDRKLKEWDIFYLEKKPLNFQTRNKQFSIYRLRDKLPIWWDQTRGEKGLSIAFN